RAGPANEEPPAMPAGSFLFLQKNSSAMPESELSVVAIALLFFFELGARLICRLFWLSYLLNSTT
ncbi:MAG: hypothetical protein MJY87_12120, partial [Fibrobacter sp.]|nr:hypothetical protein [Fibrobacter sp.]